MILIAESGCGVVKLHDHLGNAGQGGSITTKGNYSYGIYARHDGVGKNGTDDFSDISIETSDGHTITTMGDNAHGIVAYHFGTADLREIDITVEFKARLRRQRVSYSGSVC